jgi:hypothetical protein
MMLSAGAEVVHFQEQEQLEKAVSVLYQTPCPLKPVLVSSVSGKVGRSRTLCLDVILSRY